MKTWADKWSEANHETFRLFAKKRNEYRTELHYSSAIQKAHDDLLPQYENLKKLRELAIVEAKIAHCEEKIAKLQAKIESHKAELQQLEEQYEKSL